MYVYILITEESQAGSCMGLNSVHQIIFAGRMPSLHVYMWDVVTFFHVDYTRLGITQMMVKVVATLNSSVGTFGWKLDTDTDSGPTQLSSRPENAALKSITVRRILQNNGQQ